MESVWYTLIRYILVLIIPVLMFIPYLKKRDHFIIRLIVTLIAYFGLSMYASYYSGILVIDWFYFVFLIVFVFAVFVPYAICKISFKEALFFAAAAYSIQNAVDNLLILLSRACGEPTEKYILLIMYFSTYLVIYIAFYFFFVVKVKDLSVDRINNTTTTMVVFLTLFVVYVISMYASFSQDAPNSNTTRLYAIVTCTILLMIQFGLFQKSTMEIDKEILKQIIQKENDYNAKAKENTELINLKCHDLKHQIKKLRQTVTSPMEVEALDNLSEQIQIFDLFIKTGNETLDTILTEKNMKCQSKKIKLSCIIDGEALSFMDSLDMYSLFGNAIDNAIDYLDDVEEEKRIITINAKRVNGGVGIHFENYCNTDIKFENGLPITTKKNTKGDFHGYGTKSMNYIVKKYRGRINFIIKDNTFNVNIFF